MFPPSADVMRALVTQTPFFIEKLDSANLRARGVFSRGEYLEKYEGSLREFTPLEKKRVARICELSKNRCRRAGLTHLLDVNWKFAKCDDQLENGYPHTIGGIVVLPQHTMRYGDVSLIKLFVHEITHVHQRAYPEFTSLQVKALGFSPVRKWSAHREYLRANPDTDNIIYARDRTECNPVLHHDAVSLSEVSSCAPYPGLEHIRNPEHPYEILAEINAQLVA